MKVVYVCLNCSSILWIKAHSWCFCFFLFGLWFVNKLSYYDLLLFMLTVCGCETGTPTVRVIKLMAITMKTAKIDQIFIFLDLFRHFSCEFLLNQMTLYFASQWTWTKKNCFEKLKHFHLNALNLNLNCLVFFLFWFAF